MTPDQNQGESPVEVEAGHRTKVRGKPPVEVEASHRIKVEGTGFEPSHGDEATPSEIFFSAVGIEHDV